jgi:hypothetical protein
VVPSSKALEKLVFANEAEMLQIAARVLDDVIIDSRIVDSRAERPQKAQRASRQT